MSEGVSEGVREGGREGGREVECIRLHVYTLYMQRKQEEASI